VTTNNWQNNGCFFQDQNNPVSNPYERMQYGPYTSGLFAPKNPPRKYKPEV
jgi:hypothetical protein